MAGKVSAVERRTTGGFLRGAVSVFGLGEDQGSTLTIDFQNEWTVARKDRRARRDGPRHHRGPGRGVG